jgi:hypothetical protein
MEKMEIVKRSFAFSLIILLAWAGSPTLQAAKVWEFQDDFESVDGIDPSVVTADWEFSDGFEGVPGGTMPADAALDLDPHFPTWNMVNFWENLVPDQTVCQVVDNAAIARTGNNYLQLQDAFKPSYPANVFPRLMRHWDGSVAPGDPLEGISLLTGEFEWKVSARITEDDGWGFRGLLGSRGGPAVLNTQTAIMIGVRGGFIVRGVADNPTSIGVPAVAGQWYDFKIVGNTTTETYEYFVDDVSYGTFPFNHPGIPIRIMEFLADFQTVYLDDISVASVQTTTTGCNPEGDPDADPDTSIWNAVPLTETGDQTDIQVFCDPSGAFSGDKYVHIKKGPTLERFWSSVTDRDDPNQGPYAYPESEFPVIVNEDFTVEFAMKVGNAVHGGMFWLGRRNEQPTSNNFQGVGVGVQGSAVAVYAAGPEPANLQGLPFYGEAAVPIADNRWYHYRMVAKVVGQSPPVFDLYVDGQLVGTDLPWWDPFMPTGNGLNSVHMKAHEGSLAVDACFDNIRLMEGQVGPSCASVTSFLKSDLNEDCYVNLLDLLAFVQQWLDCSDPTPGVCD